MLKHEYCLIKLAFLSILNIEISKPTILKTYILHVLE